MTARRLKYYIEQSEAEFKEFEPRFKHGWFHLKLYSPFRDLSRRSIGTGFWRIRDMEFKIFKFGLWRLVSHKYNLWMCCLVFNDLGKEKQVYWHSRARPGRIWQSQYLINKLVLFWSSDCYSSLIEQRHVCIAICSEILWALIQNPEK